jgi:hypothetical protein
MTGSIYLCGPINGCTDAECKDWRAAVNALWGGPVIDPMRRDYRGREGDFVRDIVELDKIDIMSAAALIVSFDKPSVGASMEMLFAFERGKLIVVVARPDAVISPWLRYHSHRIVHSYEDAVAEVRSILASG